MKTTFRLLAVAAALATSGGTYAAPFVLSNGPGDGSVTVGVDGYGSFGRAVGSNSTDAVFNPLGATPAAAGTTFDSGVAIRFATTGGTRQFLTSGGIGSSGGLTNPTVSGGATSGSSSFVFGGLSFNLLQSLTTLSSGGSTTGSLLTQTYTITNTSDGASSFELVRYLDGDLLFDGSLIDGGGRLQLGGAEVLFEIDSATGASVATTFVGISAEGGTAPAANRFEIDSFSGLRSRIIAGNALDDLITNDGGDADQFIDAGQGYDVTLALRNVFSIGVGGSATYITRTFFGNGAPDQVVPGDPTGLPEPGSLALAGLALAGLGMARRRRS